MIFQKFIQKINQPSLSEKEQGLFAERLSLLLGASMSLPEAIIIMRNSFGKRRGLAFVELENCLNNGMSFELALSKSTLGFSRMFVLAARIGERSGTLVESLVAAAGRIDRNRIVKGNLISALTYPSIIFLASVAIISFLVFFIMPKIMPTIESLHVPLPTVTVFFVWLSHFLINYWWEIILGVFVFIFSFYFFYKKSFLFKKLIQRFVMNFPVFSNIIRAHILSEIFDTVLTLSSTGCPFIEAINESSSFISLIPYIDSLQKAVKEMQTGIELSIILRRNWKLFPDLCVDSLAIGERTGNMESILSQMSKYYSRERESALTSFSKLIEPALMIIVGIIVGAAALSIVLPVYEISQHLSG